MNAISEDCQSLIDQRELQTEKQDKWENSLEDFDKMKDLCYDGKLEYTKQKIRSAIDQYGDKVVVANSWGKDSIINTHIAKQIKPDIKVVYCNHGLAYPECLKFRDKYLEKHDLNYFEIEPEKNFWEVKDMMENEYGHESWWPQFRGGKSRDTGKKTGKPRCCNYLKEKPMYRFVEEHDIKAIILGNLAEESYQRKFVIIRYGIDYKTDKDYPHEVHKFYPLGYWSEDEVWRYIEEHDIPENKHYEKFDRNGCVLCTAHIGWREQIGRYSEDLLQMILKDLNGQSNLDEFSTSETVKNTEKNTDIEGKTPNNKQD